MANLGLRSQWPVRFCRLKKVYEISLKGVVQTRLEWKPSDDWTLDIGVGEVWAYFRRCRSVEQFVGGIWGILGMGCRAGRSARLVTQEFLGS